MQPNPFMQTLINCWTLIIWNVLISWNMTIEYNYYNISSKLKTFKHSLIVFMIPALFLWHFLILKMSSPYSFYDSFLKYTLQPGQAICIWFPFDNTVSMMLTGSVFTAECQVALFLLPASLLLNFHFANQLFKCASLHPFQTANTSFICLLHSGFSGVNWICYLSCHFSIWYSYIYQNVYSAEIHKTNIVSHTVPLHYNLIIFLMWDLFEIIYLGKSWNWKEK